MKSRGILAWGDSRGVETTGTGWQQEPQGYKCVTNGQLRVIKGMQPCEQGKDSFKDNKEDNEHISNVS